MPDDSTLIPSDIVSEGAHEGIKSLINTLEQLSKQNVNLGPTINLIEELALKFKTAEASVEDVQEVVKDLTSTFSKSKTTLDNYNEAMRMVKEKTNDTLGAEKELANTIKKTMIGWRGLSGSIRASISATEEAFGAEDVHTKKIVRQFKAMEESIKRKKAANIVKKEEAILEAKIERAVESHTDSIKRQSKAISALGSDMNGLISGFGGTSISLKGAVDSVLKYDQSVFDLKRTYQAFGVSSKDMSSAFRDVSNNTTFSKQEFADFANEVSSGYSSMNPTISQVGGFAELLQNQFGPSVTMAKENAKELLGIFDKYPPAMDAMMGIADLMKTAEGGGEAGKAAEKEIKNKQALLLSEAEYSGASIENRKKIIQLTTLTSDADKKVISAATAAANVKKESADLLLSLGESLRPSIETIASGLSSVLGYANQLPNVLMLSVGAFGAIGAIMKSKFLGTLEIIPGKFDVLINKLVTVNKLANGAANGVDGIGDAATRSAAGISSSSRKPGTSVLGGAATRSAAGISSSSRKPGTSVLGGGDAYARHEASKKAMQNEIERKRDISASKESAAAVKGGGKDAEEALGKGAKRVAQAAQTPSRNAGGGGGGGGDKGFGRFSSKKQAAGTMASAATMTALTAAMVYSSTKSASEAKGYSEEDSKSRATRTAGAGAAGSIVGGLIGAIGGPAGVMIGSSIGGMIGTGIGDHFNEKDDKEKDAAAKKSADAAAAEAAAIEKANTAAGNLSKNWDAIKGTHEANMKLLSAQADVLTKQADIMNDLFALGADEAKEAYGKAFDVIGDQYSEATNYMETLAANRKGNTGLWEALGIKPESIGNDIESLISALDAPLESMKNKQMSLQFDIEGGESATQSAQDIIDKQKELNDISFQHRQGTKVQTEALKAQETTMIAMQQSAAKLSKVTFGRLDTELELNASIEGRINIERDLMESANFGMGASIKMMQQQVNLAYENIKANQTALKAQDENIASKMSQVEWTKVEGKENAENIKQIIKKNFNERKGLKSGAEITANMEKLNAQLKDANVKEKDRDAIQINLNQGVKDYNKHQTKSMQAQKKIYDLTKDIREGYLGAVREMVSGAGEFEKIIGTHDMGVTQLMDVVKDTTGEERLNTMALGGRTVTGSAASDARTGDFGGFTQSGIDYGQMGDATAMNTDIHNMKESEEKFKKESSGEASTPTVGVDMANKNHSDSVGAARETTNAINDAAASAAESTRQGINSSVLGGNIINPSVRSGDAVGQSTQTKDEARKNSVDFGGNVAAGSTAQTPATSSPTTAPGPLPTPTSFSGTVTGSQGEKGATGSAGTTGTFTGVPDFVQEALAKDQQIINLKKAYKDTTKSMSLLAQDEKKETDHYRSLKKLKGHFAERLDERAKKIQQRMGTPVKDAGGTTHYNADQDLFFGQNVDKNAKNAESGAAIGPVDQENAPSAKEESASSPKEEELENFSNKKYGKRKAVNYGVPNISAGLGIAGDTIKNMGRPLTEGVVDIAHATGLMGTDKYTELLGNNNRTKDHTDVTNVKKHKSLEKQRLDLWVKVRDKKAKKGTKKRSAGPPPPPKENDLGSWADTSEISAKPENDLGSWADTSGISAENDLGSWADTSEISAVAAGAAGDKGPEGVSGNKNANGAVPATVVSSRTVGGAVAPENNETSLETLPLGGYRGNSPRATLPMKKTKYGDMSASYGKVDRNDPAFKRHQQEQSMTPDQKAKRDKENGEGTPISAPTVPRKISYGNMNRNSSAFKRHQQEQSMTPDQKALRDEMTKGTSDLEEVININFGPLTEKELKKNTSDSNSNGSKEARDAASSARLRQEEIKNKGSSALKANLFGEGVSKGNSGNKGEEGVSGHKKMRAVATSELPQMNPSKGSSKEVTQVKAATQHNKVSKEESKVASAAVQADYSSRDANLARSMQGYDTVASGGSGGSGGVSGEITINLGDGLKGQIDNASGLAISLGNSSFA